MKLYHVSTEQYAPGQVVKFRVGEDNRFTAASDEAHKQVINFLDSYACGLGLNIPKRSQAVFAFSKPEYAQHYKETQYRDNEDAVVYEIEMQPYLKAPMALCNQIFNNLRDEDLCSAIAGEYYAYIVSPEEDKKWHVYEYLGTEFTVVEPYSGKYACTAAGHYMADTEKASKLFRKK